jgi:GPH family glycoside/pentoside/hexuronide:cation symporter
MNAKTPSRRLSLAAKLGWGVGDLGLNIFFKALGLLMFPFYTDILGLDARLAGTVILIASLFDGLADSVIGAAADRTRTRYGSYRPYLLFASPLLVLTFTAAFIPISGTQAQLFAYALVTQMALRVAYGLVAIPYSALSSRISSDSDERSQMAGIRIAFAMCGGIVVTYLMPTITNGLEAQFGAGSVMPSMLAALISGLASLPFFWICFAATREPPELASANPAGFKPSAIWEDMKAMAVIATRNGPLMRVFGCLIVSSFAFKMTEQCLKYYVDKYLERPDLASVILPAALFVNALFCLPWAWVAQKTSKRDAWLLANVVSAVGYLAFWFYDGRDPLIATALLSLISIGNAAYLTLVWAMIPDTVEYNEWKTGQRHDGKIFGASVFAKRFALGLNAFTFGWLLSSVGYVEGQTAQTEQAVGGIKAIMSLIPLAGLAVSSWIISGYRIDRKFHARISQEAANARQNATP